MQTVRAAVGRCEPVLAGGHSVVINLNVGLGRSHLVRTDLLVHAFEWRHVAFGSVGLHRVSVGAEQEVALAHVLAGVCSFDFAGCCLA